MIIPLIYGKKFSCLITDRISISRALGCILYEVYHGKPPFFTNNVFHLIKMIGKGIIVSRISVYYICINLESVKWPKAISTDMRSFLEGLLTKDSTQRLTWPDLLHHPFVRTGVKGKIINLFFKI
jgi:fused-like protein